MRAWDLVLFVCGRLVLVAAYSYIAIWLYRARRARPVRSKRGRP